MSVETAVAEAFGNDSPALEFAVPRREARRRLWDVAVRHHCVLLGASFDVRELRQLFRRAGYSDWRTASQYELHCTAVCRAKTRNDLSALMHKSLEGRFRPAIARFNAVATASEILQLWRALAEQGEVTSAYWAALTHPAWDTDLDEALSREMHMAAHQEFGARRMTMRRVGVLEQRAAELGEQLADAQRANERFRIQNNELRNQLHQSSAELREARAEVERWRSGEMAAQLRARHLDLEAALNRAHAQTDSLHRTLRRLARRRQVTEEGQQAGIDVRLPCAAPPAAPAIPQLSGRRVLCIGGKTALMPQYRGLVERAGGNFAHHDGGMEHHVGRLPVMLAAAQVVICLAGDCSHAAYRLAKRYCKAKGKPCLLLGSSSVSAVARCVSSI